MKHHSLFLVVLLVSGLSSCGRPPQQPPVGHPSQATPPDPNRVEIPGTVRRNLGITFARVEVRRVGKTLRVPGAFEWTPNARREYRATLPGRIELLVEPLQPVEEGTPLYRLRTHEWPVLRRAIVMADHAIQTAKAELNVRTSALAAAGRRLELVRERIESLARADFRQAELELEEARLAAELPRYEAEVELARTAITAAQGDREEALRVAATVLELEPAQLEARPPGEDGRPYYETLEWIEVAAARSGVVEDWHVPDGSFVEPPQVVISTVDSQAIRFRAHALQADLEQLLGADRGWIVPTSMSGSERVDELEAELAVGLEARALERTIPVLAHPLTRPSWARAGISAFLEIPLEGTSRPGLAVPAAAVVRDGLRHVVFRRDPSDPDRALRVEADMGASDGRWVVLESGVARGDEVVLQGAYELRLATQQGGGAAEGGHFHADGSFHGEH